MRLLNVAKAHVGVVVLSGAVLVGAAAGTTAVAMSPTSTSGEVGEVFTTTPAQTTEAPEPVPVAAPVVEPVAPVEAPPAATVDGVTEPEAAPVAPALAEPPADPTPYDPEASWVDQSGQTYIPAPERTFEKLPGEPGYVPPAG